MTEDTTIVTIGDAEVHLSLTMQERRRGYNAKLNLNCLNSAREFDYMMAPEAATKLKPQTDISAVKAFGICKGQLVKDHRGNKQRRGHTTELELMCVQNSYVMLGWLSIFGLAERFELVAGTAIHMPSRTRAAHMWLVDTKTSKLYDVAREYYDEHIPQLEQSNKDWDISIAHLFERDIRTVVPLRCWAEVAATGQSPIIGYGRLKEYLDSLDYYMGGTRNAEN